ncbi:MAG: alpha/beta fold hydrolase [Propionibacteriaceae bacterium]
MTPMDLHATRYGESGSRIVFLHGLFGQGRNWTSIAKDLAADHRVLLLDMPDHGRSGWNDTFSYVQMADQLADFLAAETDGEPCTVVGHSMGGKAAMLLALRHRELVEQLGVVDISPVSYHGLSNFADYVRAMRSIDLTTLPSRGAADEQMIELVPDPVIRGFLLQNLRRVADGWGWQMNLDLLGDHLDDLAGWTEPEPGTTFDGPVLWIAGSESRYIRDEFAPAMRALFPLTRTFTIKGAGHWVHSEAPEIFLQVIRQFAET